MPHCRVEVGQAGLCARLWSRLSAKLLSNSLQRRQLIFHIAEGSPEHFPASQPRPKRHRILGFEPTTTDGKKIVTIKIPFYFIPFKNPDSIPIPRNIS
jgi:hypothetical protein